MLFPGLYTPIDTPFETAFISVYMLAVRAIAKLASPITCNRSCEASLTNTQSFLPFKPQSLSDDHRPCGHNRGSVDNGTFSLQETLVEDLFEVEVAVLGTLQFFGGSVGKFVIIDGTPFPFLRGFRTRGNGVGCLGAVMGWLSGRYRIILIGRTQAYLGFGISCIRG